MACIQHFTGTIKTFVIALLSFKILSTFFSSFEYEHTVLVNAITNWDQSHSENFFHFFCLWYEHPVSMIFVYQLLAQYHVQIISYWHHYSLWTDEQTDLKQHALPTPPIIRFWNIIIRLFWKGKSLQYW